MSKCVMIVPDLHAWDKSVSSFNNYVMEVKGYFSKIRLEIIKMYNEGVEITLVIGGDFFERSFTNFREGMYWNNTMLEVRGFVERIVAVLGNHEMTYSKDNPFWHLVQNIDSEFLKNNYNLTTFSSLPIIEMVDTLELGAGTLLHMGHYGRKKITLTEEQKLKKNILVTHNDVVMPVVCEVLKRRGQDLLEKYIQYENAESWIGQFDEVYVAHMHSAYSTFMMQSERGITRINWIASLGRPNSRDVRDTDLERTIHKLWYTETGEYVTDDSFKIQLLNRVEALNLAKVEENQKAYQDRKEIKEYKRLVDSTKNPFHNLLESLTASGELEWVKDLKTALNCETPEWLIKFEQEY